MRIGINALYLLPGGVGGTEVYLRSLLSALAEIDTENHYIVFTNLETGGDLIPKCGNFEWAPLPVRASIRPLRVLFEQFLIPIHILQRRVDVLFNPGFTAPILARCEQVTVFHDLQHRRFPRFFRWYELPFWRMFLYLSAMRSKLLVAVSRATCNDLITYYRLRSDKIRVVPHGVDPRMFEIGEARRPEDLGRYVLCVSTLHAHKNLGRLLRAFRTFRERQPDFRLVLVGLRGTSAVELELLVDELGLRDAVRITGWIERSELYELFRKAWAFVYPSSFEGFGMPVTEALAAGIPTACSAIEPLTVVSGAAAVHFDPDSDTAVFDALCSITGNETLRAELSKAGPTQASRYSWKLAAQRTLQAIVDASGLQPRSKSSS